MRALRYTKADSYLANAQWGATCGPHSLAAACGRTLDQVWAALENFRGWMSPTQMERALWTLGQPFIRTHHLKTSDLCEGINRIQWEGSWLNPDVPPRVAYFHTHWVAHSEGFVLCTATDPSAWVAIADWRAFLARTQAPFHVTHHYQIGQDQG